MILLGCYYFPYSETGPIRPWLDAFLQGYAASAGFVIRQFDPSVRVVDQDIIGRYSLRIVKTCDAMDVTILLTSAIVAWPGRWRDRGLGAAAAIAVLFAINVLRICSLYWIGIHFPSLFEVAHVDVWPAIVLVLSVAVFLAVAMRARASDGEAAPETGDAGPL